MSARPFWKKKKNNSENTLKKQEEKNKEEDTAAIPVYVPAIEKQDMRGKHIEGQKHNWEIKELLKDGDFDTLLYSCSMVYSGEKKNGYTNEIYSLTAVKDFQEEDYQRFRPVFSENIEASLKLENPFVIKTYDWGFRPGLNTLFSVTENLEGSPLSEIMKKGEPLDFGWSIRCILHALNGLAYLHWKLILHNHLSPSAIFITDEEKAKIFYLNSTANMFQMKIHCRDLRGYAMNMAVHNYPLVYRSPDRSSPNLIDGRSDLYSSGLILYEMVTGNRPFGDSDLRSLHMKHEKEIPAPPSSLNPDIPLPLEKYIMRLLEKNPDDRYESAKEAAEALKELARDARIDINQTGRVESP